jgi:hypothetical protein
LDAWEGRIVCSKGYGSANLELGVPISPKTVFYVGSVSKQFTAGAVKDGGLVLERHRLRPAPIQAVGADLFRFVRR